MHRPGDQSAIIDGLAGGPEFHQSFLLTCLSNDWIVRAVDVDHALLPPAGAWAYTEKNFRGLLRQLPANCQDRNCVDIATLDGFTIKSLRVGANVRGQLFAQANFKGQHLFVSGDASALGIKAKSLKLRTPPRVDYAGFLNYKSADNQSASFDLHLSGANIDSGAVVRIDGRDQAKTELKVRLDNSKWLGLGTDIAQAGHSLDPTYFGYPIYHYDALLTSVTDIECDRKLHITVRNPDGQLSNVLQVRVPTAGSLDSDGDGLLDAWELGEVDGLDLTKLGANPLRKDLYIEVDRMIVQERMWSDFSKNAYPRIEVFADAEELFRQAPILNPDGSCGVSLHIDYGQEQFEKSGQGAGMTQIPWTKYIGTKPAEDDPEIPAEDFSNAMDLHKRPDYFATDRRRVFRYCIFADQQWASRSTGGQAGPVFFMSLGVCRLNAIDHNYQLGVFVHEFGHSMGLSHTGNANSFNSKPNFNSLMNYLFTFPGRDIDGKLGDISGDLSGDQIYVYSEGMRANMREDAVYEALGVANHYPHDWNKNGQIDNQPIVKILRLHNADNNQPHTIQDFPDWANLKFNVDN